MRCPEIFELVCTRIWSAESDRACSKSTDQEPISGFSALPLGTGVMFSRACHQCHVFPPLSPVSCFPALGTGVMFSRAWHRCHVFSRLALVLCFPALGTSAMFSRAWQWCHVFPRLAPVSCFPALDTGVMFCSITSLQFLVPLTLYRN